MVNLKSRYSEKINLYYNRGEQQLLNNLIYILN